MSDSRANSGTNYRGSAKWIALEVGAVILAFGAVVAAGGGVAALAYAGALTLTKGILAGVGLIGLTTIAVKGVKKVDRLRQRSGLRRRFTKEILRDNKESSLGVPNGLNQEGPDRASSSNVNKKTDSIQKEEGNSRVKKEVERERSNGDKDGMERID